MSDVAMAQALQVFFAEAREMNEQLESALLTLEDVPNDAPTLDALFRAAHTIKGSAGMFGLDAVVAFTHRVETLLDQLRSGAIGFDSPMATLLFGCNDYIRALLGSAEVGSADVPAEPLEIRVALAAFLGGEAGVHAAPPVRDRAAANTRPAAESQSDGPWHVSARFLADTFREGFDPLSVITYLGSVAAIQAIRLVEDAVPALPDLDPEACHLRFEIALTGVSRKEDIEAAFEFLGEMCELRILPPDRQVSEVLALLESTDTDGRRLGEILVDCKAITTRELNEGLASQRASRDAGRLASLGEVLVNENLAPRAAVAGALERQGRSDETRPEEARFVRVRAEKLDALINLVGELVIAGAGIAVKAQRFDDESLSESATAMGTLIEDIRNGALSLRMTPVGESFARFKRVVRDVSAELGKEVALEVVGAETEIDKSVAEKIGDPLMHLVRNALDHGLETPQERVAAGKPARGNLRLSAAHEAGGVLITIEDDGRGIRRDRVLARAIERGILPADAQPSDEEIDNLIFEAGFSTADHVTNLSGRGVGMDVVRRNIDALRGSVRIESRAGAGTRIRIRLPLTLAIIDGFLVRVGETAFALPLDHVVECVEQGRPHVAGTGIMTLRDSPLPVIDLASLFEIERDAQARGSIVVVRQGDAQVGIAVDHLLGEFQAVIKPLGAVFKRIRCIGGSTILGSGEVGLVVDVPALMQYAADHCSNDLLVERPAVQPRSGLALAS